jgi:hypothetical protein
MIKWYKKKVVSKNKISTKTYSINPCHNIAMWNQLFNKWQNYIVDEDTYNAIKIFLN